MSDNDGKEETMQADQKDLFRELSREQAEAEKALEEEQERSGSAKPQDESDD
ncbi:hypothetical protein [Spirosoma fluviale]|uniref:Uncharacterized protein n=1 Tax=Spirosoma fluviale TaxID=1597977 RepID=A0A286G4M3_9BACT|nr:hypothetical protein [Spirosoma fluviale]SOD90481.1 hypothetical protein SAMN06269250_3435 [Spirosoma fluviale]